jgi:hypothetical protein
VGGLGASAPPGPGPPTYRAGGMDEQQWVQENAALLREVLARQGVRAEVLALLDGHERDRARRLDAARAELADVELRWRVGEDEWT